MSDRQKAVQDAWERGHAVGYRRGRIEARAELLAIWRARVGDAVTILDAPLPLSPAKDDK